MADEFMSLNLKRKMNHKKKENPMNNKRIPANLWF